MTLVQGHADNLQGVPVHQDTHTGITGRQCEGTNQDWTVDVQHEH